MSTHNIGFNEDLTKIILELSSNTHLISSAAQGYITSAQLNGNLTFMSRVNNCLHFNIYEQDKQLFAF